MRKLPVHMKCQKIMERGRKTFKCIKCGKDGYNYTNGIQICHECCDKESMCRFCGEDIKTSK